jgi:uncharacterized protein (DUF305 family)
MMSVADHQPTPPAPHSRGEPFDATSTPSHNRGRPLPPVPRQRWLHRSALALCALAALVGWGLVLRPPTLARTDASPPALAPPNEVDVGFSQTMLKHHRQAVEMAQIVLHDPGMSPAIRGLANSIEIAQLQEIGQMTGWLDLWRQPSAAPPNDTMGWMTSHAAFYCTLIHGQMPGLATGGELDTLARSSGKRADILFLQLMLRHHEGGIEMGLYAARYAHLNQVRSLASSIVLDQTQEIGLMARLLSTYHAPPLPFPGSPALAQSSAGADLNTLAASSTTNPSQ